MDKCNKCGKALKAITQRIGSEQGFCSETGECEESKEFTITEYICPGCGDKSEKREEKILKQKGGKE